MKCGISATCPDGSVTDGTHFHAAQPHYSKQVLVVQIATAVAAIQYSIHRIKHGAPLDQQDLSASGQRAVSIKVT